MATKHVWLLSFDLEHEGLELSEVEAFTTEKKLVQRMLDFMGQDTDELAWRYVKNLPKMATVKQLKKFIEKHYETLGHYDDVFYTQMVRLDQ